jgi:hypothetical protein
LILSNCGNLFVVVIVAAEVRVVTFVVSFCEIQLFLNHKKHTKSVLLV